MLPRRGHPGRYTRGALLVVALFGACATAGIRVATSAPLSYEDARAALHTVSDLQKSGEAGVNKRDYEARAADSLGLPDVSVNATQVFGVKTGSIQGTPLGPINIREDFTGPRSSINSTWSIYTGGRITATQRALAAGAEQARAELSSTEEHLDLELAQVYFGLELAANVEHTRSSILRQADQQLERAVRFEKQGLVPKVERLNAQVSRDEAARELVRAQRDREIAQARLQRLLRRDVAVEPSTPLFVITGSLKPLAVWLAQAERQNPILAAFDAKREQAEQGIVIAESRWKPQVFAFGSYSFLKNYQTLIEPNWVAGIGVNFTLFSREDRSSQVSAAREALRQVQSLEAETRNDIDSTVETSYRKVEQAREQFLLLESTLAFARENLRLRERGFDEGQATILDVNDARTALARAETARAVAAYDFVVALAQLLESSGQARALPEFFQQADFQLRP
jgi:outer membrane protein TolC